MSCIFDFLKAVTFPCSPGNETPDNSPRGEARPLITDIADRAQKEAAPVFQEPNPRERSGSQTSTGTVVIHDMNPSELVSRLQELGLAKLGSKD